MLLEGMNSLVHSGLFTSLDYSMISMLNPIDANRLHDIDMTIKWHARLMSLAWSFFFPVAILAARFYKVLPRQRFPDELDNQWWWNAHRICVALGTFAALMAALLVWFVSSGDISVNRLHRYAGWSALTLLGFQIASGFLRGTTGGPRRASYSGELRGDHFDMTRRRIVFEHLHKSIGYIALACAWIATIAGLWSVNAPVWIWILVVAWWMTMVIFGVWLQMHHRAIDTYQAIWGTDPKLTGNQMTSIGVGVRRVEHLNDK